MYNIRLIKYPEGYQFKVYSESIMSKHEKVICDEVRVNEVNGDMVSVITGEVLPSYFCFKTVDEKEYIEDEWYTLEIEEDSLEAIANKVLEEQEARRLCNLRHSIARTRNSLYYIARSNRWEYFLTLTLSPDKINRYDFMECSKRVRKWFNHLKERKCSDMYYLIVPEMHKDGAWHFHGLIGGCTGLNMVDSSKRTDAGAVIYNLDEWKFGWSTATKVTDSSRCSSYICKYITKDMCSIVSGRQRYWVSNNVQRAEVFEGYFNEVQMKQFRERLYENMTWKKEVQTEFINVEYFELPADESILS